MVFRVPGDQQGSDGRPSMKEKTLPVEMAHLLGYHINTTETRVLLRCAYGSRLAYILQVRLQSQGCRSVSIGISILLRSVCFALFPIPFSRCRDNLNHTFLDWIFSFHNVLSNAVPTTVQYSLTQFCLAK